MSSSSSDDDISSTVTGTDAQASSNGQKQQQKQQQRQGGDSAFDVAAKSDTRDVAALRWVVAIVLICSAVGVGVSANYYITDSEDSAFRAQFKGDSEKVFQAIGSSLEKTLGLMDGLAVTLVSSARFANQTWPCVSLPDFAVRMSKVVPLTDAVNINVLPVVTKKTRAKWEDYVLNNDGWVDEAVAVQENWDEGYHGPIVYNGNHNPIVHGDFEDIPLNTSRNLLPLWQNFPVIANTTYTYGYDWLSSTLGATYESCIMTQKAVMSKPYLIPDPDNAAQVAETAAWADYFRAFLDPSEEAVEPVSDLVYPIVNEVDQVVVAGADDYDPSAHAVVGMVASSIYWRSLLHSILPDGSNGIQVVFENPCTSSFAYELQGPKAVYLGVNYQHESAFTTMRKTKRLATLVGRSTSQGSVYTGAPLDDELCQMTLSIYPSAHMKAGFTSTDSTIFTVAAVAIFAFTSLVFWLYDSKVERRQGRVLQTAVQSSAIVSSLFPTEVRNRLYPIGGGAEEETGNNRLRKFAASGKTSVDAPMDGLPIADLYPDTTVFFADIVGFTAWSSVRNPTQVFCLLETIYGAFDAIAKRRGVFKVETIGDSYVAAAGLPMPQKHHAVVMCRFANDCRSKFRELVRDMDETLGPGTADLNMRIGLNSGPTTAGVLRGEKSRFQLFGDTVNTAARMESNGKPGEIQVSQKTADLIIQSGKGHWLTPRLDAVDCKGKGKLSTYWCNPGIPAPSGSGSGSVAPSSEQSVGDDETVADEVPPTKTEGLVNWCYGVFLGLLNEVVVQRSASTNVSQATLGPLPCGSGGAPLAEVREVLDLPNTTEVTGSQDGPPTGVGEEVAKQLQQLIAAIAGRYQGHAFHNFEHCCHVVMSTKKLLDRIYANHDDAVPCSSAIARDPITRLGIVFSALIHDVDHPGVSNAQLVQEGHALAVSYENRSVAEQNSIDSAWQFLMAPQHSDLRACLFATESDMKRFRQVVVNSVMATDLFDKQLKSLREERWQKSFADGNMSVGTNCNRRATIIIDLIIQASDVSHTMQHFTVYKKWNMSLLAEMYEAYSSGRSAKDPTEGWYEGELWFFDNYIIPLAQKLRECGVFGVSCDEFLDYAKDNRIEWEAKGQDIVRNAAESLKRSSIQKVERDVESFRFL